MGSRLTAGHLTLNQTMKCKICWISKEPDSREIAQKMPLERGIMGMVGYHRLPKVKERLPLTQSHAVLV